jgi:UDP-glucose 4-epimerase
LSTQADLTSRRILVTGGAGFIGSHLADLLLARGHIVTVVDDLSTGRRSNLPSSHPGLRFIEADLGEALHALGKGEVFDEVYHLAAAVGVKLITSDPIRSIETNIEQTAALLRFVRARGNIPTLLASSSEVYGKSPALPFREQDDVVYGPTSVPRWSYAFSKAIDEYLGLAYVAQHGLPVVISRFFNTVGPRQVGEYGMVLPRFVSAALAGHPLEVHGDGMQTRCFCDVRDVAGCLPRLLSTPACVGQVFNVGSEQTIAIGDLAQLVVKCLQSRSEIRRIPYSAAYGERFEDLRHRRPDLSKLRSLIGFSASIPLERTILDLAISMRR